MENRASVGRGKKTSKTSFLLHLESKTSGYFQCIFPKSSSCHISRKSPEFATKAHIEQPLVWWKVQWAGSVPGAAVQEVERWAHLWFGGAQEVRGSPVRCIAQGRRCICITRSSGWGAWQASQVSAEPLGRVVAPLAQLQRCRVRQRWPRAKHNICLPLVTAGENQGTQVTCLSPPQHTHSPPNIWPPWSPCSQRTPTLGLHASQTHSPPFPVTTTNPLPTAVPGLTLWGRMGGKPSSDVPSNSHSSRGPCWKVVSAPSAQWRDLPGAPNLKLNWLCDTMPEFSLPQVWVLHTCSPKETLFMHQVSKS